MRQAVLDHNLFFTQIIFQLKRILDTQKLYSRSREITRTNKEDYPKQLSKTILDSQHRLSCTIIFSRYLGYIFWTSGVYLWNISGTFQVYLMHVLGISLIFIIYVSWVYFGYVSGISQVYLRYILGVS